MGESLPPRSVEATGPWPFTTRRVYRFLDRPARVWSSRHHRKGLPLPERATASAFARALVRSLWMPRQLNWWIATIFAVGSLLFVAASLLVLFPALAQAWSTDPAQANVLFFAGSIPFTTAAYLQLFQAANAGEFVPNGAAPANPTVLFGWRPHDLGWLSCAIQFAGTLLFNLNTFDAMVPSLDWLQSDLLIWAPDFVGSVLFLLSGYMAFIETCHAYWAFEPTSVSWWVVFVNLLGCVGFMVSAVFAVFLPGPEATAVVTLSVDFTLAGAVGFLIGSLLMLPEAALSSAARPSVHFDSGQECSTK